MAASAVSSTISGVFRGGGGGATFGLTVNFFG